MESETMEKTCRTCLYAATHERCDGCLSTPDDWERYRKTGKLEPARYLHYKEGNWLKRVMMAERDGRRNIVIGGQGEAEVNAKDGPDEAARRLRHVAEQCGYLVTRESATAITVSTHDEFRLTWDSEGLESIQSTTGDSRWSWSRADCELAAKMAD